MLGEKTTKRIPVKKCRRRGVFKRELDVVLDAKPEETQGDHGAFKTLLLIFGVWMGGHGPHGAGSAKVDEPNSPRGDPPPHHALNLRVKDVEVITFLELEWASNVQPGLERSTREPATSTEEFKDGSSTCWPSTFGSNTGRLLGATTLRLRRPGSVTWMPRSKDQRGPLRHGRCGASGIHNWRSNGFGQSDTGGFHNWSN